MRKKLTSDTGNAQAGDGSLANTGNLYIEQFNQNITGPAQEMPSEQEIADALALYRRRVGEAFGRLDLEVLTPLSVQDENPEVRLREVFVPPQVRADPPPVELPRELMRRLVEHGDLDSEHLPPGAGTRDFANLHRAYAERPPVGVLPLLADPASERLVLLGDPGAGKSTLARYLALALTGDQCPGALAPLAGYVPVVIELRRYAEAGWRNRTFEDFMAHLHAMECMCPPPAVLAHLLSEQRVLVVFDGLDELFDPAVREATAQRIAAFAARYPGVRIVVTSRIIGYRRAALDNAHFTHHMLQDLTTEQIGIFAEQWYTTACAHEPHLIPTLTQRVTDAVTRSRPVRELAGNPLLLTILAIIGRRQTLPRDRQGVFEHAVTVLVAHWDRDAKHLTSPQDPEAITTLDARDRHELLRLLARRMQDGEGGIAGNHIHGKELVDVFRDYLDQFELPPVQALAAARAMVRQLRERNFILSRYGGEVYGFVHRAFLEYLAAADIAHRYKEDREWDPDQLANDIFARHASDPSWHEVLLLVIGQLPENVAARGIDKLLEHANTHTHDGSDSSRLELVIRALAEVRKIGRLTVQSNSVIDTLIQGISSETIGSLRSQMPDGLSALTTFPEQWSGRQRYLRWFHACGHRSSDVWNNYAAVARALYTSPCLPLMIARFSPTPAARQTGVYLLANQFGTHRAARQFLIDAVHNDPADEVRATALSRLASRAPLATRHDDSKHSEDRGEAVRALLEHAATHDPAHEVRAAALNRLANLSVHHNDAPEEVGALLEHAATHDPAPEARATALTSLDLLSNIRDQNQTSKSLSQAARNDQAPEVRATALFHLSLLATRRDSGKNSKGSEVEVRALLEHAATHDPAPEARASALNSLTSLAFFRDGPEDDLDEGVRTLLIDAIRNDEDGEVRATALGELSFYSDGSAEHRGEVGVLLDDAATHDPAHKVRATALNLLATRHNDSEGEVRAFLDHAATHDPAHEVRAAALNRLADLADHGDSATRVLLAQAAHNDQAHEARATALNALVRLASRHGEGREARALLTEAARHDPAHQVRSVAIKELAGLPGAQAELTDLLPDEEEPSVRLETLQLLLGFGADAGVAHTYAQEDVSPLVRIGALWLLAFTEPDAPATRGIIRDRAERDPDEEVRSDAGRALEAINFYASWDETA